MRRTKVDPEHRRCVKVVMHFRDASEAKAILDAASIDDRRLWKVEMRECEE